MANYEVDPSILKKYLPAGTEPDEWEGRNYVSLVGFQFFNTRILNMKIPFHVNFEEVNLRFYVKRKMGNAWQRGVVFISEIVPKMAIAFIANTLYHENYRSMPMRSFVSGRGSYEVEYQWKFRGNWNSIKVRTTAAMKEIQKDSEEEFITEHYWGFNKINAFKTTAYQVEHPRWNVCTADEYFIQCDFEKLYGTDFSFLQQTKPLSVFLAAGSAVNVRKGFRI